MMKRPTFMMKLVVPILPLNLDGVEPACDLSGILNEARQHLLIAIGASFIMKLLLVRHPVLDLDNRRCPLFSTPGSGAPHEPPHGLDGPVHVVGSLRASPASAAV